MICFRWNVDNGERAPNFDDILQASYLGGVLAPFSPNVTGQSAKDITILVDKTFDVSLDSVTMRTFNVDIPLRSQMTFNQTLTTGQGAIYIAFISDDGAVSYPFFQYIAQVQFKDM